MKTKKAHQTQAHALSILNRQKITFQKTELKQKITQNKRKKYRNCTLFTESVHVGD